MAVMFKIIERVETRTERTKKVLSEAATALDLTWRETSGGFIDASSHKDRLKAGGGAPLCLSYVSFQMRIYSDKAQEFKRLGESCSRSMFESHNAESKRAVIYKPTLNSAQHRDGSCSN